MKKVFSILALVVFLSAGFVSCEADTSEAALYENTATDGDDVQVDPRSVDGDDVQVEMRSTDGDDVQVDPRD